MRLRICWMLLICMWAVSHVAAQSTAPVMMLSDLHFDPLHDPAKAARLAAAPVGEWETILGEPESATQQASFASVQLLCTARGVDTDHELLSASLKGAKEHAAGIAFVTVTGDLLVHGFECRYNYAIGQTHASGYREFAEKTAIYVMQRVEAAFPGVPVYFANGNNDSSCGDYRMNARDRFLKATSPAVIAGLRGARPKEIEQAQTDYEEGGYFAAALPAVHAARVLVLNDLYLSDKYRTCESASDAAGGDSELAWLDRELSNAKLHGEQVWVLGHIPPGIDAYSTLIRMTDVCGGATPKMFLSSNRLAEELEKYADVVRLGLFGHTHSDELRLLEGEGGMVPLKLVASISPVNGNRPTFTVAQVNRATGTLADYTVYEASNSSGAATAWAPEYSFRQTYHEPDFSASSVKNLIGQFEADKDDAQPASRAYGAYFAPAMLPVLSLVWPKYACALGHTTEASFKACVCGGPK